MGEGGLHDVADFAGAGGDVLEADRPVRRANPRSPGAQSAQHSVVGAVVHGQTCSSQGLFDRGVYADAGALIAGIGQRGEIQLRGGPAQRAERVVASSSQVVCRSWCDLRDPDGQPSGRITA